MADKADIQARLQNVFQDVFDDEEMEIFPAMTAKDVDDWDSLKHITLVLAVEKTFGVTLNAAEVGNLANVGQMIDLLAARAG